MNTTEAQFLERKFSRGSMRNAVVAMIALALSCGSQELTRPKAIKIMKATNVLPMEVKYEVAEEVYGTVVSGTPPLAAFRKVDPTAAAIVEAGFLGLDSEVDLEFRLVKQVRQKFTLHPTEKVAPFLRDSEKGGLIGIVLGTVDVNEVTGIQCTSEVECVVTFLARTTLTDVGRSIPFDEAARKKQEGNEVRATFSLYDDGWRMNDEVLN